eukprot:Gregarina_sp_Poly_1__6989@NODE_37_length_18459_cov_169_892127_g32_i0_p13_GENE_NODE_37_length_18459_cov_169_892127_g32_i0NODE_37_length_18459_cov_169_892127_g32_i0_p13_ORF_typecomplete_len144_score37_13Clathrin_lg_ch/PF01086_17/0_00019Rabaptin/PF03528_15/0_12Fzo_mitofusin/PF04799_13/0_24Bud13/PF09736_9/0_22Macoilin/PF09726_9/0_31RGS_DHEX/PF18148_1/0_69ApoO/PF09769_9/0_7AAA_23/PF13476_6/2_1FUSC/PF04632_12/3_6Selenoprotein_S/PF06936_11/5_7CCDC158/PF15921_5/11_NODE_37_length_18459_cov_169_892127_g32
MERDDWIAYHAQELSSRKQEEADMLEESKAQAQKELQAFFAAQQEEVSQNEFATAQKQRELEAEIKALEDSEEKMDWILVRDIVDRVLGATALEIESAPVGVESARKNLDRLVKLAVAQNPSRASGDGDARPVAATLVDELIL